MRKEEGERERAHFSPLSIDGLIDRFARERGIQKRKPALLLVLGAFSDRWTASNLCIFKGASIKHRDRQGRNEKSFILRPKNKSIGKPKIDELFCNGFSSHFCFPLLLLLKFNQQPAPRRAGEWPRS